MLVNRSVFVKYTEKYILWKNIGLHRDDGLSCFDNKSKPKLERIRKKIYKTLKDNCLNITIETNMDITDYLDITFNWKTGIYYPYIKQNISLRYIRKQSNHPPSIMNQIPSMISKRLPDIPKIKKSFDKTAPVYNKTLKYSGLNETLHFRWQFLQYGGKTVFKSLTEALPRVS